MLYTQKILVCAVLAFGVLTHATENTDKVRLTKKEYLRVNENGTTTSFVKIEGDATPFVSEDASETLEVTITNPDGSMIKTLRSGAIPRRFTHKGKYLSGDLTLHPDKAEEKDLWFAPLHPDYFNYYHPQYSNMTLIAEGDLLTRKQYLKVVDDKCVFVDTKEEATIFTREEAEKPKNFVGSSHRAFRYGDQYLYFDLTLRKKKPTKIEDEWLAPIHPLYLNYYHSGPNNNQTLLIAEEVRAE
jgi:hypothetical protein